MYVQQQQHIIEVNCRRLYIIYNSHRRRKNGSNIFCIATPTQRACIAVGASPIYRSMHAFALHGGPVAGRQQVSVTRDWFNLRGKQVGGAPILILHASVLRKRYINL
jgi:hypothetical protein